MLKHKKRICNILILFIFLGIPLFVYRTILKENVIWGGIDNFQWLAGNKYWAETGFSFWQKYYAGGTPTISMYPISVLLSWLPENYFVYIYYCLHIGIGSFFMYKYLRELQYNAVISFVIGLLYEFSLQISGLRRGHMVIISVIVYMPVVFFLIQKYFNTKKMYWLLLSSFALALATYGGSLQHALYLDIIAFLYIVVIGIKEIGIKKTFFRGMAWGMSYISFVSVAILSTVSVMWEYAKGGTTSSSFTYFSSYSAHPVKLLGMFFPELFGGEKQLFGVYNSSEVDTELFLGFVLAIIVIFGIIYFYKDFYIKISCIFWLIFMVYCMCPHIPYVNELIYHTPILGGFRCISRAFFIPIFFMYVIVAKVFTEIVNKDTLNIFKLFLRKLMIGLIAIISLVYMVIVGVAYIYPNIISFDVMKEYLQTVFFVPFTMLLLFILVIDFLQFISAKSKYIQNNKVNVIIIAFGVITLLEVYPYSSIAQKTSWNYFEQDDLAISQIETNIGNGKVWEAFPSQYDSSFSMNYKAIEKNIQFINHYAAFNNPNLYKFLAQTTEEIPFNNSGLLRGSDKAKDNLLYQNNFLSMMGIKYIIDNHNLIDEDGSSIRVLADEILDVLTVDQVKMIELNGNLGLIHLPLNIESDGFYEISFVCNSNSNARIQIDFYGGRFYDSDEQQTSVVGLSSGKEYTLYLRAGDISVAEYESFLRLFSYDMAPYEEIELSNFKVRKHSSYREQNTYIPFYSDEVNRVYENTLANDILNVSKAVVKINEEDYIFDNMLLLDLKNISYVKGKNSFDTAAATIDNVNFGDDYVKADIIAEGKTFVNFAECYFTGWRAYVDGDRVPLYKVNGIIMGIEVPEGVHEIEFRYIPMAAIIGGVSIIITIVLWIMFFYVSKKEWLKVALRFKNR